MDLDARLLDRCHINKNDEGDRFVGIKADSENAMVYFLWDINYLKLTKKSAEIYCI